MTKEPSGPLSAAKLKSSVPTLGLLGLIVSLGIAVFAFAGEQQERVKAEVGAAIRQHCDSDVDRAHQDMPRRYTPRAEHERAVLQTQADLRSINQTLQEMQRDMRRIAGRR